VTAQPRLDIRFSGRLDVAAWERRHAAGEVPDRWPYGLHRLFGYGFALAAPAPRPVPRLVARGLHGLGGYEWLEAQRYGERTADLVMCWDERIGVPTAHRGGAVALGVIWLTDRTRFRAAHRLAAGPALRRARRVWALSSAQLPVLRDGFGVCQERLHHLLFGIDASFFTPAGSPAESGLVLSVGNDRHRDYDTVLRAMVEVKRTAAFSRLELVTRQQVAVPAGLGVRRVELSHDALRERYRAASVVTVALRPNLHVSGITVALEAMATGRPLVITDTPGMGDYVTHGETGLLVKPGDADAFAAAVTSLLQDPDRAAAMGVAGRKAVEDRFNTEAQAQRLTDILRA
jgi:glycosyltransferase involved in cell wall biosynthesis